MLTAFGALDVLRAEAGGLLRGDVALFDGDAAVGANVTALGGGVVGFGAADGLFHFLFPSSARAVVFVSEYIILQIFAMSRANLNIL